ncbi:hypothetical protein [Lacticaseibacillus porcinae]|uniref:hypothetical protein n=1 Tax=Lacticaseibacillus porcinae TaxID=1123687 RepID=UPI001785C46C|nr:hypothetical protein [Lacticaseibacillus porcinae]
MIVGILVSVLAIAGIGVVSVLQNRHRWPYKLWPAMVGLSLLAIGGLWQAGSAQATPKDSVESTSSSSKPLNNNGKLSLDGKTFTADFDDDDTYAIKLSVKAGDRVQLTDSTRQNGEVDELQDVNDTVRYEVTAVDEPAKLHLKLIHNHGYKTANFTVMPDPDRESKYASSSSKQAVADSISESSSLAAAESAAASESKAEADSISASKAAEVSASISASNSVVASSQAQAASAQAEANKYNTGITYDQLARDPDTYMGKLLHLTGKVIQVVEGSSETDLRVAIDGNYNNVVLVVYDPKIRSTRILEDDKITFYGLSLGTQSYTSTLGGKITVPLVQADKIDDSGTAPSGYGY